MFHYFVIGWLFAISYYYQLDNRPSETAAMLTLAVVFVLLVYMLFWQVLYPTPIRFLKGIQSTPWAIKLSNLFVGAIIGWAWAGGQSYFTQNLPPDVLNQHILLEVQVLNSSTSRTLDERQLRQKSYVALQKVYLPASASGQQVPKIHYQTTWLKPKVQLSLYLLPEQMPVLNSGETWLLAVKLKAPVASQNPFNNDHETYLFQQGIQAKGYLPSYAPDSYQAIRRTAQTFYTNVVFPEGDALSNKTVFAVKLADASYWDWRIWRSALQSRWQDAFANAQFWRIYQALLLGERNQMTADDWRLFQQTGTSHLMAISGLHLAIMAALGAALFSAIWWLGAYRLEAINLPMFSAFGAALLASGYLLISGMAIPTQRAWIMVMAFILFMLIRRKFQPWSALALAVFTVLLIDSRAVLAPGFWLSFGAVALIFLSLPWLKGRAWWQQLFIMQLVLTLGLAPLLIWQFSYVPLFSFFANLLAIPLVSFVALPLLFISALSALVWDALFVWLLPLNDFLWHGLWRYLNTLAAAEAELSVNSGFTQQSVIWLVSVYVLVFASFKWWQSLKSSRPRASTAFGLVTIFACLMMFGSFKTWQAPAYGTFRLTLFDVGQGLALSIETANHRMIYDAGPKWGSMSAAQFSIIPYWQRQGSPPVDLLMISHSDNDHAGGLGDLLSDLRVHKLLSGQPQKLATQVPKAPYIQQCVQGQNWLWDGVRFEVLAPSASDFARINNDNDFSCVLKITTQESVSQHSVLITGDLGSKGEAALIAALSAAPHSLQADVLLAGHHGSRNSSSAAFLQAVAPSIILFSAAYQNHFDFPNQAVLQRIALNTPEARLWNTACSGAMQLNLTPQKIEMRQETRKARSKWYYQRCKQDIK
ncbi:DNA internalization-related competence protein ComEC/Rec2 [Thiosulfatimonas sediminis]|uniref:DNA internalization-related competence protein ComEC/Rec2 n=1 Tax=Thiosulfatimonas sediminis TaxID=2675054 RepID=A0A6F8PVG9_9GAMM|nr:DNA internalization-related competence protein ComEC/Rec2 [Thiosulfatimonas sediminis]BBP46109.1 DNA internalization-related competence protein ComEC/Rec2 [Thiosulfatimonas sediminis]